MVTEQAEIKRILFHLRDKRWISFKLNDSNDTFAARDKLRAYGLIEEYKRYSWRLTLEGYKAIEVGGFDKWVDERREPLESFRESVGAENVTIIRGENNRVNQVIQKDSPRANAVFSGEDGGKRSWIEVSSWILGILAALVAIYQFLIKDIFS